MLEGGNGGRGGEERDVRVAACATLVINPRAVMRVDTVDSVSQSRTKVSIESGE